MDKLEERRKVEQIPIYDKDGRIEYYKIPNYTIRNEFMTNYERNFMRTLINIVKRLNEEYKEDKIFLQISTQVALNRIIDINNRRNAELYEEIKNKSIDYVLYDLNNGKILCCIELDGIEHEKNVDRKTRDILLKKMLNEVVKIIHIKANNEYNENEIIKKIKEVD